MCLINANQNNNNNNNNNNIVIIKNKQNDKIQKIVTTTAKNKKITKKLTQFPSEEIPRKMQRLRRPLGKSPIKSAETAHKNKNKKTMGNQAKLPHSAQ